MPGAQVVTSPIYRTRSYNLYNYGVWLTVPEPANTDSGIKGPAQWWEVCLTYAIHLFTYTMADESSIGFFLLRFFALQRSYESCLGACSYKWTVQVMLLCRFWLAWISVYFILFIFLLMFYKFIIHVNARCCSATLEALNRGYGHVGQPMVSFFFFFFLPMFYRFIIHANARCCSATLK